MKRMGSAKRNSKSNGSSTNKSARYVVCIHNAGYPVSLETRKLYRLVPDSAAEKQNLIRVIDESGEDYLYPAEYFVALRLPQSVKQALTRAS